MPLTTLPSTHCKPSADELDRTAEDNEPADDSARRGKISGTIFSRTSQCLLRGLWASYGEKGIGPSPFTQATFNDGKAFEKSLLKDKSIWIQALNQALGTDFSPDLPLVRGTGLKLKQDESPAEYAARAAFTLATQLPGDLTAPFALHEPQLAAVENGTLLHGMPDLLIWTGTQWLISDIKCSEEARRTHGIQISAYARMLRAMQPADSIHPSGVVIHCANGYRYTDCSSQADQSTALAHTQATPFPLASLDPVVADFIKFLSDPTDASLARALREAIFSSICNECEFRHRCYPRFLEAQHISLLPLMKAELESILAAGITTIQGIIDAIDAPGSPAHQTLLELKDDSPIQLGFLRQKAAHVLKRGLYSCWRAAPTEIERPLFFAAVEKEGAFSPDLNQFTREQPPTCLVVYSEGERRMAWAKIYEAGKKGSRLSTFVLSKIVQQTVHGPLPSITLRPLADLLATHPDYDGFLKHYPECTATNLPSVEEMLQDSPTAAERMQHLQLVWNYLTTSAIPFSLPNAP